MSVAPQYWSCLEVTNMENALARPRRAKTAVQRLKDLLAEEGYRPRLESREDGPSELEFKVEGRRFLLRAWASDEEFVQVCTGVLLDEGGPDEATFLRLGNELQAHYKGVKTYLPPSRAFVEFQIELFLGGHPLSPELLERCIHILQATDRDFCKRLEPEVPKARA
jgi:hypothetical protein